MILCLFPANLQALDCILPVYGELSSAARSSTCTTTCVNLSHCQQSAALRTLCGCITLLLNAHRTPSVEACGSAPACKVVAAVHGTTSSDLRLIHWQLQLQSHNMLKACTYMCFRLECVTVVGWELASGCSATSRAMSYVLLLASCR